MERDDDRCVRLTWRHWLPLLGVLTASGGYTTLATNDRFTGADAARMEERVKTIEVRLGELPPAWLTDDLAEIKTDLRTLRTDIHLLKVNLGRTGE